MSRISADSISSRSGGNISVNNDLVVETNVTINSTGVNAVGVITATRFVGSGSSLTGISNKGSLALSIIFGS